MLVSSSVKQLPPGSPENRCRRIHRRINRRPLVDPYRPGDVAARFREYQIGRCSTTTEVPQCAGTYAIRGRKNDNDVGEKSGSSNFQIGHSSSHVGLREHMLFRCLPSRNSCYDCVFSGQQRTSYSDYLCLIRDFVVDFSTCIFVQRSASTFGGMDGQRR